MQCLYMKHLRGAMDYDDRRRLAKIVTATCASLEASVRALILSLLRIAPPAAILKPQPILSVARNCVYKKPWFVGKLPGN